MLIAVIALMPCRCNSKQSADIRSSKYRWASSHVSCWCYCV